MGNSIPSSRNAEPLPLHVSLFIPIFGTPDHVNSFTISSAMPYPKDPLFGTFILAPWFEQVANKMPNDTFLKKFQTTTRYDDNYEKNPVHPVDESYPNPATPGLIILLPRRTPNDPEGLHYRTQVLEFETAQYPIINTNPFLETKSAHGSELTENQNETPTHVPFLKISLPFPQKAFNDSTTAQPWDDSLYPDQYFSTIPDDYNAILPFRGLGQHGDYKRDPYKFEKDKKKPYTGLGGDGIKTEYQLFNQYQYPRKSVVAVRPLQGYSLDNLAYLPHIDTIPGHHLATILILDMISMDGSIIFSDFINQTRDMLQRGCLLPLVNVNIYIMQLNGAVLEQVFISNEDLLAQLVDIGFEFNHIHFCPLAISPDYPPSSIPPEDSAFPLISKTSLTHFLTPIWEQVYTKTFQLHSEGHWDRLARPLFKDNKTHLIPPHHFPANYYQRNLEWGKISTKLLQQNFQQALSQLQFDNKDQDQSTLLRVAFAGFYRMFEIKAMEYFGNGTQNNIPNKPSVVPEVNRLESPYKLMFGEDEPLWDDISTYFPNITTMRQLRASTTPLPFDAEFDIDTMNNGRELPVEYRSSFKKQLGGDEGDILEKNVTPTGKFLDVVPSSQRSSPTSHEANNKKNISIVDELTQLGLSTQYEFESFILWSDRPVIADQYNLFEQGYIYEPHVLSEIHTAVEEIKRSICKQFPPSTAPTTPTTSDSSNNVSPPTSLTSPFTTLRDLLPSTTFSPSKPNQPPTPYQYLLLSIPYTISRVYPAEPNWSASIGGFQWLLSLQFQKRLTTQTLYKALAPLVGLSVSTATDSGARPKKPAQTVGKPLIPPPPQIPPILKQPYYKKTVSITYAHTRVEFAYTGLPLGKNKNKPRTNSFTTETGVSTISLSHTPDQAKTSLPNCDETNPTNSNLPTSPSPDPNPRQDPEQLPSNTQYHPESSQKSLQIGITYLHRTCFTLLSRVQQCSVQFSYLSHQFYKAISFLPLAWLHGVYILPFIYINSRTKLIRTKLENIDSHPAFLNRPIGTYPGADPSKPLTQTDSNHITDGTDGTDQNNIPNSSHQPTSFRGHPLNFIPPPIPTIPLPARSNSIFGPHHTIKHHNYAKTALSSSPTQTPFTLPLPPPQTTELQDLLPDQLDYSAMDPCHFNPCDIGQLLSQYNCPITFIVLITNPIHPDPVPYQNIEIDYESTSTEKGSNAISLANIALTSMNAHDSRINQLFFDDCLNEGDDSIVDVKDIHDVYSDLDDNDDIDDIEDYNRDEIKSQANNEIVDKLEKTHKTISDPCAKSALKKYYKTSMFEPITQSQFRYYQEYIPQLYKIQLVEQIFGHGIMGGGNSCGNGLPTKLERLWTVEVHTPRTVKAAIKRIESDALEIRLKLYRDMALKLLKQQEKGN